MNSIRSRLIGLAALVALVGIVVGIPALLVTIAAIPGTGDFTWSRLVAPDDGSLAIAVITIVAWVAWLVLCAAIGIELGARIRGITPPHLPWLGLPQLTAGRLVALASLAFVAAPLSGHLIDPPHPAAAASSASGAGDPVRANVPEREATIEASSGAPTDGEDLPTVRYLVKRGDSLWRIAENELGDGRRFPEIVALNESVLGGRPDFISPGTVLLVPAETGLRRTGAEREYVVRAGDTLSEIAESRLGDENLHPRIFEASRQIEQADGRMLSDPDFILPGWRLAIPTSPERESEHHQPQRQPLDTPPNRAVGTPRTDSETADRGDASPSPALPRLVERDPNQGQEPSSIPAWAIAGLTGAGAALAGALLLVLRQHRRTQLRYRRPGMIIEPPPVELRAVEKTSHLTGSVTAPAIEALDTALRDLAARCADLPPSLWVGLGPTSITLRLARETDLPAPWTGRGDTWTSPIAADFDPPADQLAPYPLLVSVGQKDDGELVLLNLEELGSITVAGEPDRCAELLRHIAAELALNPWSTLVEIDTVGVGAELADLDPVRLRHHSTADTTTFEQIAVALEHEARPGADPDRFRALLIGGDHDDQALQRTAKIITHCPDRTGAALLTTKAELTHDQAVIRLTMNGRLEVADVGLDLVPAGLTAEEAIACARIVEVTSDAGLTRPPADTADDLEPLLDAGGAVRPEASSPRPAGPAGADSLLPLATTTYVDAASTTADDIDQLARVVPKTTRDALRAADPTLDDDLALWSDQDAPIARLVLLGPVNARAHGNPRAVAKRKPFYVELLSFLTLRPQGASSREVADAFGLTIPRARTDVAVLRSWLGTDPRTGELYLPTADATRAAAPDGVARYVVRGVLTDLELFRRLRARAQSKGAGGVADLQAALDLVTGEPFSHLRPAGWSWLLGGDRIDHVTTCAIADVGHLLTTRALADGALDLARRAAEAAHAAVPDDETCRLDLIHVAAATGHVGLAERQLVRDVLNRTHDGRGPIELPERTTAILERNRCSGRDNGTS